MVHFIKISKTDLLKTKLTAIFYRSLSGNEPVREWLQSLSKTDKKFLGTNIQMVQFGWPIGMPLVKHLADDLWEVRSNLTNGRTARILFFMYKNTMVLLHWFIKKQQKTPRIDLQIAKNRKKEIETGNLL